MLILHSPLDFPIFLAPTYKNTNQSQLIDNIYSGDLELKKWGAPRGQGKSKEVNINVRLVWWCFVVLKINLL